MKRLLVIIVLALAVPCLAFGQAQTPQPPKPAPEIEKLAYFVGTWKFEAGKSSGTFACQWFKGGFFLVCHEQEQTSGTESASVWGYDAKILKQYTGYTYRSDGTLERATGSILDKTWIFNLDPGGYSDRATRMVLVPESPTSATVTWQEYTNSRPSWTTTETARMVKVK